MSGDYNGGMCVWLSLALLLISSVHAQSFRNSQQHEDQDQHHHHDKYDDDHHHDDGQQHPHLPTCEEEMMMNMETCKEVNVQECGVCHDMYMQDCQVHIHESFVPVKVRECIPIPDCILGKKRCFTKYRKECTTEMVYQEKEENHPMCGVMMVQKCSNTSSSSRSSKSSSSSNSSISTSSNSSTTADHLINVVEEEGECRDVPVMKCHMEKKMKMQETPQEVCRSVPEEMCDPDDCLNCFYRVSMKRSLEPREECEYKKKRVCQEIGESADCRIVSRVECAPTSHLMIKKICSPNYDWMLKQMP